MAHYLHLIALFSASLLVSAAAGAVTIVQCEDDQGNRTYNEHCPPGTQQVEKKDYSTGGGTGGGTESEQGELTATLYRVPECPNCDQVREFLAVREISITVKDVKDDVKLQDELKEKAGELRVPTTIVGEQTIVGFNRTALLAALAELGYEEPEATESPAASAETTAESSEETPTEQP